MTASKRRHHIVRKSRSSLKWYLIIFVVTILIAAVLGLRGGLIDAIEEHADVLDTQYIPMDLDRKTMEELKDKTKSIDRNMMEQLKKKFQERSTKQGK